MPPDFFSPALVVALTTYTIGVASPGPSNMAIMATAMSQGRGQAIVLASGIICGSLIWGLAAAFGLSALMHSYWWAALTLKLLGGLYLLFLSWKAVRAALESQAPGISIRVGSRSSWRMFASGLGMHITNPKAIFVWLSIVALALPPGASRHHAFGVVAACGIVGTFIFYGYALAFSTAVARRIYAKIHKWFNALLASVLAFAGLKLLLSRSAA